MSTWIWPLPTLLDGRKPVVSQRYRPPENTIHDGVDIVYWRKQGSSEPTTHPWGEGPFVMFPDVPVYAAREGIVRYAYLHQNGWRVSIVHPDGYITSYLHLAAQPLVKAGDRVVQGQQLGCVGDDPSANDIAHLHFILMDPAGNFLDPETILEGAPIRARASTGGLVVVLFLAAGIAALVASGVIS